MSVRAGSDNILTLLRDLQDKINRLMDQGTNYRTNSIRIGDAVISWNSATNQLIARNAKSGGPSVVIATVP